MITRSVASSPARLNTAAACVTAACVRSFPTIVLRVSPSPTATSAISAPGSASMAAWRTASSEDGLPSTPQTIERNRGRAAD